MSVPSSINDNSRWTRAGFIFLGIFAVADFLSISVAQIAAAGLVVCWVGQWVSTKTKPDFTPLKWPITAFVVASILAALFSLDVMESIRDSKDLLHIAIFFAAYDLFRRDQGKAGLIFRLMAASAGLIAAVGVAEVAIKGLHIHHRITGFQDIWMTYAGLLMLAIVVTCSLIMFTFTKWRDSWLVVFLALMAVAMILSLTRNAWIGAMAGVAIVAVMRKPISLAIIPALSVVVFLLSPAGVQDRITSMVDLQDDSNRERLLLWRAGAKIWADYPVFGVGQNSFPLVYPQYRDPGVLEPEISHLHNNFLEIGVERGIIGFLAWLSIWCVALFVMVKAWMKRGDDKMVEMALVASIGSVTAFLAAGMFEYNFGDSEIQMLVYFILAIGLAASGADSKKKRQVAK
ncbi:hypothetical protein MNBD_NITROSPINAE02-2122 [hydrothermal vent metagenome]|uniref:O-antigen ligase-related domain-containing protein n=1 Tax=hydrothermal vent metagenome TaxID=652676 RepID=A0A3B1BUB8_9ZZZZ